MKCLIHIDRKLWTKIEATQAIVCPMTFTWNRSAQTAYYWAAWFLDLRGKYAIHEGSDQRIAIVFQTFNVRKLFHLTAHIIIFIQVLFTAALRLEWHSWGVVHSLLCTDSVDKLCAFAGAILLESVKK